MVHFIKPNDFSGIILTDSKWTETFLPYLLANIYYNCAPKLQIGKV